MKIDFFIPGKPPRATGQMRRCRVVCGRPQFYDGALVKQARAQLHAGLAPHAPSEPIEGAIALRVSWVFPATRKIDRGTWKLTRPDTDNLQKILKDEMTRLGYWQDDAQVALETVSKRWSNGSSGEDDNTGVWVTVETLRW